MSVCMLDGPWAITRRVCFGIVIVSRDDSLLAYGNGTPPSWINNAVGAECWAVFIVTSLNPVLPSLTTDCLGILQMLELGAHVASLASWPLARIWSLTSHALVGD